MPYILKWKAILLCPKCERWEYFYLRLAMVDHNLYKCSECGEGVAVAHDPAQEE